MSRMSTCPLLRERAPYNGPMDRIVDEIVLFGLGLPLLLLAPAAPAAVAAPLLALIATGVARTARSRRRRCAASGLRQRRKPHPFRKPCQRRALHPRRTSRHRRRLPHRRARRAGPRRLRAASGLRRRGAEPRPPALSVARGPPGRRRRQGAARWRQPPFCWERSPAWPPGARPKFKPSAPRCANGATPCRKTASRWPSEPATSPSGKIWK